MRCIICAGLFVLTASSALAQSFPGQLPANNVLGNPTGSPAPPTAATMTQMLDAAFCTTPTNILQRGASVWGCVPPSSGLGALFSTVNTWTASQTFNGGFTGSGPVSMLNTTVPGTFATPGYLLNDDGITGLSFSDASTHVAVVVTGNSPATGTGSYAGFDAVQYGSGRTASAFVTGSISNATAVGGNGNYTGANPYVVICGTAVVAGQCPNGTAATVASAVGAEIDIFSNAGATMFYKQGIRIADLGVIQATGTGHLSAGIVMVRNSTAPGFDYGLYFGDPNVTDNSWPLTTTGSGIKFGPTSHAIDSLIDASATFTGGITTAAFKLPDNLAVAITPTWKFLMTSTLVAFQTVGSGINAAIIEPNFSAFSGYLQSGEVGINPGAVVLLGQTSGSVTIEPGGAAAGSYNFNLPVTAGAAGNVLVSGGGGANAMGWVAGPTKTCGATIVVTGGVVTSC